MICGIKTEVWRLCVAYPAKDGLLAAGDCVITCVMVWCETARGGKYMCVVRELCVWGGGDVCGVHEVVGRTENFLVHASMLLSYPATHAVLRKFHHKRSWAQSMCSPCRTNLPMFEVGTQVI